jgi:hypothetical protein
MSRRGWSAGKNATVQGAVLIQRSSEGVGLKAGVRRGGENAEVDGKIQD